MPANHDDTKWYSYTSSTQTTRTWARRLKSYEEVPTEFLSAFPDHKEEFPYTLLIPEVPHWLSKNSKQILCVYEDRFVHLELLSNKIKMTTAMFTDVLCLEHGKVLLHAWLKIAMLSDTLLVRFNTTDDHLFQPVVEKIRQGIDGLGHASNQSFEADKQETSPFAYLISASYKFMNYGRDSVRPFDTVRNIVYQPPQCVREIKLFNRVLFGWYTTDHLAILTERELILIKEEKPTKTNKEKLYGGVFTYIPRHQIQDITFISKPENSQCIMGVVLPGDHQLSSEFSSENEELILLQASLG